MISAITPILIIQKMNKNHHARRVGGRTIKSIKQNTLKILVFAVLVFALSFGASGLRGFNTLNEPHGATAVFAKMPFYNLRPQKIVKRAEFYTSFSASSAERKNNIAVAAKALDKTFIDVGGEFSFNKRVGARTEARGYKKAKIIVSGKFVEGVGGGVCQVSTTLYNAALLSGLTITEYHPHSLPVSYIAPSFDAMVNSGSADLKFVNNTDNPIIIFAETIDSQIKISVFGEPLEAKFVRKSVVTEKIAAPAEEIVHDEKGEFPDLFFGERKVLSYSKEGYKSEGYLIKLINGSPVSSVKIRTDVYASSRGKVVEGTRPREYEEDSPFYSLQPLLRTQ